MKINRAQFHICTASSFGGVKTDTQNCALWYKFSDLVESFEFSYESGICETEHSAGKSPVRFLVYKANEIIDANIKESHQRSLPFGYGTIS